MQALDPYIALTDKAWFDFLSARAGDTLLDEVNFWSPLSQKPLKKLIPGQPVFFRLKSPINAIAGYGFFAHFGLYSLRNAWDFFESKNGDPDETHFLKRIGGYRKTDLLTPYQETAPLGCTILRSACFWPEDRWLEWGVSRDWKPNIVRGATETNPQRSDRLMAEIAADKQTAPENLIDAFRPVEADERTIITSRHVQREGQGTFRARLLDAYGRRCAITGERTELVLDAAHIQPYLGPRSNHIQNGLLLTKEFHTLFDNGYVTVSRTNSVQVSARLRQDWHNGKRYYEFDGVPLRQPVIHPAIPSEAALGWHREHVFKS